MIRMKSVKTLIVLVIAISFFISSMPMIAASSLAESRKASKKATRITKVYHTGNTRYTRTVNTSWTLKYKLSPSGLNKPSRKVVWTVSEPDVARISSKRTAGRYGRARITFKEAGYCTVTVRVKNSPKVRAVWRFKAVPEPEEKIPLTGVSITAHNLGAQDISKHVYVGNTLCAYAEPQEASSTAQWYADDVKIVGATRAHFKVTDKELGKRIRVEASGVHGFTGTVKSEPTAPVTRLDGSTSGIHEEDSKGNITDNTIPTGPEDPEKPNDKSGDVSVLILADGEAAEYSVINKKLTAAVTPEAGAPDVRWQWYKEGRPIEGGTQAEYTPTEKGSYSVVIRLADPASGWKITENIDNIYVAPCAFGKQMTISNLSNGTAGRSENLPGDTLSAHVPDAPLKAADGGDNYSVQWYIRAAGETAGRAIAQNARAAKYQIPSGHSEVAVVDNGDGITSVQLVGSTIYCEANGKADYIGSAASSDGLLISGRIGSLSANLNFGNSVGVGGYQSRMQIASGTVLTLDTATPLSAAASRPSDLTLGSLTFGTDYTVTWYTRDTLGTHIASTEASYTALLPAGTQVYAIVTGCGHYSGTVTTVTGTIAAAVA